MSKTIPKSMKPNTKLLQIALVAGLSIALIVAVYSLGFADLPTTVNVSSSSQYVQVFIVTQEYMYDYYTQGPVTNLTFGNTPAGASVSFRLLVHNTGNMTMHNITWSSTLSQVTDKITDNSKPVYLLHDIVSYPQWKRSSQIASISTWPVTLGPNDAFVADYTIRISPTCPLQTYSWTLSFAPQP